MLISYGEKILDFFRSPRRAGLALLMEKVFFVGKATGKTDFIKAMSPDSDGTDAQCYFLPDDIK